MVKVKTSSKLRYYFLIAEFYIAIDFSKIEEADIIESLDKFIKTYYQQVITYKDIVTKSNFEIFFIADERLKIMKAGVKNSRRKEYFIRTFSLSNTSALVDYHVSVGQFQFLLKTIIQNLLDDERGFMLHASAISDGKRAHIFLGPNGAGKSTMVANLREVYMPFADDVVIIRYKSRWLAHQFPLEKNNILFNRLSVPIENLFWLEKREETHVKKIALSIFFLDSLNSLFD